MVIAGSWILAVILQLREYGKKVVDNSCVYVWSEEFVNSFSLMWHSFVFVSCIILAGLYSRVVHTLWFRRTDHDEITHHQQVWINIDACKFSCATRHYDRIWSRAWIPLRNTPRAVSSSRGGGGSARSRNVQSDPN